MYSIKWLLRIFLFFALLNISATSCEAEPIPTTTPPVPTPTPVIGQYLEEEFLFRDGVDIWGVVEQERLHIACTAISTVDGKSLTILDCGGVVVALDHHSAYVQIGKAYAIQGVYIGRMVDIDMDNNPIYWPIVRPLAIVHLPEMEGDEQ